MKIRPADPDRSRPLWRRLLVGLVLALVAFEIIWWIGANWALSSGFVLEKLNQRPQKLLVEWESARTWAPIWITFEGVSLRSQSQKQQIYGTLERVSLHASLLSLATRTVRAYDIQASGVDFRMRRRDLPAAGRAPAADPPDDEPAAAAGEGELSAGEPRAEDFLPEIPGLEPDMPIDETQDPGKKKEKKKSPWTLQFDDVHLEGIRQIWIDGNRLTGDGTIDTGFRLQTQGGPLAIDRAHVEFQDILIRALGFDIAKGMDVVIDGSMDSFQSRDYRGLEVLKFFSATVALTGRTTSVGLINLLLSHVDALKVKSTGGEVDGLLKIEHGVLQDGTRFTLDIETGWVQVLDWRAQGQMAIETTVVSAGEDLETAVRLSLDEVEMFGEDQEEPFLEGASLQLAVTAEAVDLAGGGPAISGALTAASLDLRNARVADLSRFPRMGFDDLELQSGDILVESSAVIGREGGRSRVVVGGQGITAAYEDATMKGDLAVEFNVVATDGTFRNFGFSDSFVHIDNVEVTSAREEQADWYLHLGIHEGEAAITAPGTLSTTVDLSMQDTRPLVALLAKEKSVLVKLKGMLAFDNLEGQATLRMGNDILQFEDVDVRGEGLQIEANLRLGGEQPDGILWTRFRGIPLSLDLRGGKARLHLIQPRQWYEAQTDPWTAPSE